MPCDRINSGFFHQWKISGKPVEFPLSTTLIRGGSGKILPPNGRLKTRSPFMATFNFPQDWFLQRYQAMRGVYQRGHCITDADLDGVRKMVHCECGIMKFSNGCATC